ncbi:MAG TPA: SURF1 family protein [Patescibacteria group bacterium]|nr:SURF1 family protein [Patescibacteria group bacterium]
MLAIRKPRAWLLSLFIVAELGFGAAARWQWQRGEFKDRRDREFAAAVAGNAARVPSDFAALTRQAEDFAPVRLRGRLSTDRVYLHDNRIVEGEYGVDVYVPLEIDGGHVLVNLGWIAADRSRRAAPVLPELPKMFDAPGLIAPAPAIGMMQGRDVAAVAGQPSLRLNIDPGSISRDAGLAPMLARVFWPAPETGAPFRRDWKPSGMPADRHRGYALQWASFAAACLILFLMFHIRRKEVRP